MEILQYIAAFLVLIFVLVSVHEYGHFVVARWCGVHVKRFAIGMGPVLFSRFDARGTEFAIAALPIGGYVRMLDEREDRVAAAELPRTFNARHPLQKIAIALGGPLANFLLAIVVLWGLAMAGMTDRPAWLGEIAEDSMLGRAGVPSHGEVLQVDGEDMRGARDVYMALLDRVGETGHIELLVRPEVGATARLHRVPIERWLGDVQDPDPGAEAGLRFSMPAIVGQVMDDSAAALARVQSGDQFLAVDGERVADWNQFRERVLASADVPLRVTTLRGDVEIELTITPQALEVDGETIGRVGVSLWEPVIHHGPIEAIPVALSETARLTRLTLDFLRKMLIGNVSTKNLSGPISIAKFAGERAEMGFVYFVQLLGLLSVSLAVLNLLPIPVLDGGHVVFHLAELVRGSPLPERVQLLGVQVGLVIVAGLMVLAVFNDLTRL